MNCPLCIDQTLDITHHGGIEIDICPKCRGIWLDRGELERLAGPRDEGSSARATLASPPAAEATRDSTVATPPKSSEKSEGKKGKKKSKKKKSLAYKLGDVLEEVLDL